MNVVLHTQYGHCLTSQTQPLPSRNHLHHTSQHGRSLASFPGSREGPGNEARQTTYNITDTSTGHLAMISHRPLVVLHIPAEITITHSSTDLPQYCTPEQTAYNIVYIVVMVL